jgi:hypothetical protein
MVSLSSGDMVVEAEEPEAAGLVEIQIAYANMMTIKHALSARAWSRITASSDALLDV